ncbi:MAG: hypothetical protein OEY49_05085 [Candidatus Heimdallarchaeota archaeon]|nr:hypothetical protein [Candidatus Heimdallarchaeota archaeon]
MTNKNTLENKLKEKYDNGEITKKEFDELMEKFGSYDLLHTDVERPSSSKRSSNYHFSGSSKIFEEIVDGPVKVSGRLVTEGPLKCRSIKVSGSAIVSGDLIVTEDVKISGSLQVDGDAKLGGISKVSGSVNIDKSLYATNIFKISGKIRVKENLVLGDDMKISGTLSASMIKSTSNLLVSGKLNVGEDVIVKSFITSGGASIIDGNLSAETIEIARSYRIKTDEEYENYENDELSSIPNIAKFVTNIISNIVPIIHSGFSVPPKIFNVKGNMEGNKIDISYTHVHGDIIGDSIVIGPGVTIDGKIKYRETIEAPDSYKEQIEKI